MNRFDVNKLLRFSLVLSLASGIAMFLLGAMATDHPLPITILMCCYTAGLVLPCCVLFAQAMDMFPSLRASASSLIQSLRMLTMSGATYLAGAFYNGSFFPVSLVIMTLVIIAFPMALSSIRGRDSISTQS